MPIIIQNLSYIYSRKSPYEKAALNGISLTVEDGEFFGIIGPTGSGKSTLINHLNALTRIQSGKITINGMDLTLKKLDFKRLRATVGMVFQYPEYQLFDETVERDVAFGPRNLKLGQDEIAVRVREAIEMVGLDYEEIKNRSPFELSGGQKRRAAIAGVLAMRPEILVLDEPTTGLDPRGKYEIIELILRIKSRMCRTVIMISHNMDEIALLADRIAVLHEGELACVKPPRELFSERELLQKLNIQMPQVTEIASRLADAGLAVNRGIVSEDELVSAIAKANGNIFKKEHMSI